MSGARGSERIATVLFVTLVCLNFLSACMAQMNTAGSPTLVVGMGGSGAYGGFLVLVFVIASMVSRLVAGVVADNRSRRVLLVSGCIVYIIGCALPILFRSWRRSFPRASCKDGATSVNTAATTCASDVLPASRLGEGIGYYGLGHAVAMALGPMPGLALAGTHAMAPLALGALALSVIALLLSLTVVYERDPSPFPKAAATCAPRRLAPKPERVRISASAAFDASGLRGGVPMFLISGVITFLSVVSLPCSRRAWAMRTPAPCSSSPPSLRCSSASSRRRRSTGTPAGGVSRPRGVRGLVARGDVFHPHRGRVPGVRRVLRRLPGIFHSPFELGRREGGASRALWAPPTRCFCCATTRAWAWPRSRGARCTICWGSRPFFVVSALTASSRSSALACCSPAAGCR